MHRSHHRRGTSVGTHIGGSVRVLRDLIDHIAGLRPTPKSHAGAWLGLAHERVLVLAWGCRKSSGPLANGDIMCPFMYRLCG
jgi:hypothetical protein